MSRKRSSIYRMLEPQKKKILRHSKKQWNKNNETKTLKLKGPYIKSELLKYSISSLVLLFAVLHAHLMMLQAIFKRF